MAGGADLAVAADDGAVDLLVIGCGMAGMAAAIRAAMYDRSVLIVERHNAPGGLNSFYFQNGRKFDVGLHAVTNFVEAGRKGTPLVKLLRQLRLSRDDLQLCPQRGSRIAFPGVNLRFGNGIGLLESEVGRAFPGQVDGFRRLREAVLAFDAFDLERPSVSARGVVRGYLSDPLLTDMLFCPLMYYGSAREHDMDFDQFVTLWKAIYEEGFARPLEGVRVIIRAMLSRLRACGVKRRMGVGVRRILHAQGRAHGVELDNGEVIGARAVLSTAGAAETACLCDPRLRREAVADRVGRLSFTETIHVLARQPAELGMEETIVFFNDSERFHYEAAEGAVDLRSGVLCCPNNYDYGDGHNLTEGVLRVTAIASHRIWSSYPEDRYASEKAAWQPRILESALRFVPRVDERVVEDLTLARDMFTPRTIERFTGHFGGAVYGAPQKARTGRTDLQQLFLAGTDQGFLGIIGAMLSGISMANQHILSSSPA